MEKVDFAPFFFSDHLSNLPDLWGWSSKEVYRWKSRGGKSQRREEKRKSQKKEDAGARKGRKVAIHGVFPMMCGSGGSNSRLAKAGAEPSGQLRNRKLHAVLVRSTLRSQNVQSTPFSEHFFRS